MTKENTNTITRFNHYRKAGNLQKKSGDFTMETLKKQIEALRGQEFMMSIPMGGAADGR